jgi:hypothetical protein
MSIKRIGKETTMRFSSLLILVALVLVQSPGRSQTASSPQPVMVSMFQLIATPERFDGRLISVVGFLTIGYERTRLFAYETDAVHHLWNGVAVDSTEKMREQVPSLNLKYVVLVGIFKQADKEQLIIGTITKITRCQMWSDPAKPISLRLKEIPGVGSNPP